MSRLSVLLVCLLVVLAGCAGDGGDGDATPSATPAAGGDGTDGDGDAGGNGDSNAGTGTSGSDDMPDAAAVLRKGERYEYDVRSAVLTDEPESATVTVDVTADGEWPFAAMDIVRDAPSGQVEASGESAAYSTAFGEMSYALNVRSLIVNSRIVAGKSTDIRTYEVGDSWTFASSDGDVNFEVVGEERIAGLTAKHVRVTGETGTDADIWLVSGVGYPAKFVQTEDGEATIELELTAYESP